MLEIKNKLDEISDRGETAEKHGYPENLPMTWVQGGSTGRSRTHLFP